MMRYIMLIILIVLLFMIYGCTPQEERIAINTSEEIVEDVIEDVMEDVIKGLQAEEKSMLGDTEAK